MTQGNIDSTFKVIQSFLKNPPVIIWGSGATIDFGLPSMEQLMTKIKSISPEIEERGNLEGELSKITGHEKLDKISEVVKNEVSKQDIACLKRAVQNQTYLAPVKKMIRKFYDPHPKKINIITTNYDRILEYAIAQMDINYCDGFSGNIMSRFNQNFFAKSEMINLVKVHGSLNWSRFNDRIFFLPVEYDLADVDDTIVLPTQDKYKRTHQDPYRSLLIKSDEYIESAQSFFVVGFGFNDNHITPKIDAKIRDGVPITVITKVSTESCRKKLDQSTCFCILEEDSANTKVTYRCSGQSNTVSLQDDFWRLKKFMEIL